MAHCSRVTRPESPELSELCAQLAELASKLHQEGAWPGEQLVLCGDAGVYEWFLPTHLGGQGWSDGDIVRGYLALSEACLTTTFVITQRMGACKRIAMGDSDEARRRYLPQLLTSRSFATVGVSHLTTSRRHLAKPTLLARETEAGFVLDGFSPWVTGAQAADVIVVGATLEDQRQVLLAVPANQPGVRANAAVPLIGLSASQTGSVQFEQVEAPRELTLAGPVKDVMKQGVGASTGGLQTSTLAVGLASAAIALMEQEAARREDLVRATTALRSDCDRLKQQLLAATEGAADCSTEQLRSRANSLALRAAQSALGAAKGSGYVVGHPAGRWCVESLFFLVWSCPQPVMAANLCELAGISE